MGKSSDTGGVKPMSISGRYNRERERLLGMTDEERAFRKQWLKDQHLAPTEPKEVPGMYEATHNPIRRFYRWPLNQAYNIMAPVLGVERATKIRYLTGKLFLGIAGIYIGAYYFMYNTNDWTRTGGWLVLHSKQAVLEGDPGYPKLSDRSKPEDYGSRGFKDFKLNI